MKKILQILPVVILIAGLIMMVSGCKEPEVIVETVVETVTETVEVEVEKEAEAEAEEDGYMPTVGKISTEDYVPQITPAGDGEDFLIGFANYFLAAPFCGIVEEGMNNYGEQANVELFIVDNEADPAKSVDNARAMISKGVDFFIEYQGHADTNAVISEMMIDEGIPVVAIDIPVPDAPFFGGNNPVAGHIAGKWLGDYAAANWVGEDIVLVLVESTTNGKINADRMQGYIDGVMEAIPEIAGKVHRLDTNNSYEDAQDKMRSWLSGHPDANHILLGGLHDGVTNGALQALREANRESDAIIVSQGADPSIYADIRNPESAFKGSVAYFPEDYGFYTISIAMDVLRGNPVPWEYFVPHVVIDASNIDEYYPE
jgi:ribose transport system substrate-binding protein